MKADFTKDLLCRTADEWLASKPAGTKWSKRQFNTEYKDRSMTGNQPQRPGSVRKQGGCYFCGKPGHYAQECRSRIASEKGVPQQPQKPLPPVVTKEQGTSSQTGRDMAEVRCYNCQQKGHMSPRCPLKTNRVKRIKIPEDKIMPMRKNEVFGAIGGHQLPITCDTRAEVTVVPAECVLPLQLSGETCELKAFNQTKSEGQ